MGKTAGLVLSNRNKKLQPASQTLDLQTRIIFLMLYKQLKHKQASCFQSLCYAKLTACWVILSFSIKLPNKEVIECISLQAISLI